MNRKAMPVGRQGFAPIIILFIVAGVLVVGGVLHYATRKSSSVPSVIVYPQIPIHSSTTTQSANNQPATISSTTTSRVARFMQLFTPSSSTQLPECLTPTATNCRMVQKQTQSNSPKGCSGSGPVALSSPMHSEDVGLVIPMGEMIGGHVTPIDHMYFQPTVFRSDPDTYNVYADADGVVAGIGVEQANPDNKYTKIRMTIYHTCDFYSIYNLLTSLSPRLQSIAGHLGPGEYYNEPISVTQGELLGKIGGQTLDLSVNYDKVTLKGFIVPEHYASESWKIHTVDPFDYFKEPFKSELLAKDIRQAEPRGGKIDYDIDGRLVGNWFVEGTGGLGGGGKSPEYWKAHLAFAYDAIDPSHIILSIGNYGTIASQSATTTQDNIELQYAAKGNAPDPKDVSVATGLVKYELVEWNDVLSNGAMWDRMSYASGIRAVNNDTSIKGIVLVQMISARRIQFEAFPGKTAVEASAFTPKALIYER